MGELLELIHLEGLADRYPSQLSGGQRQRVALARALAIEPKVLLLDEPFGALDAKVRQGLRRWLRRLHDEVHVTSVLVTHDQEEALEVADRVVVMNQGRIEQVGTPEEVFHHPASEFVMDFMGNVNLFRGRIESGKAVFGPLVLDRPEASGADGRAARLFVQAVRPGHSSPAQRKAGLAGARAANTVGRTSGEGGAARPKPERRSPSRCPTRSSAQRRWTLAIRCSSACGMRASSRRTTPFEPPVDTSCGRWRRRASTSSAKWRRSSPNR